MELLKDKQPFFKNYDPDKARELLSYGAEPDQSPAPKPSTRKLLFLCTANYFRSRFAEMLFNHLADKRQLNWHADSRGFATNLSGDDLCAISTHTIWGLNSCGIDVPPNPRPPIKILAEDFEQADLVIALNEKEHRRYMKQQFPEWENRIEYWRIADVNTTTPYKALNRTVREVCALIKGLSNHHLPNSQTR